MNTSRESFMAEIKSRSFRAPEIVYDDEKTAAFDAIIDRAIARGPAATIDYACAHPKHEFLCYLADRRGFLLHGSNRSKIKTFEPRAQTDAAGRPLERVYATPDGVLPMYFAIVNRKRYRGSLRNWFFRRVEDGVVHRYYFFSLNKDMLERGAWTKGTVYVLSPETFEQVLDAQEEVTEEWASPVAVRPVAKLHVEPSDFPFLDRVEGHDDSAVVRAQELMIGLLRHYRGINEERDGFRVAFRALERVRGDLVELVDLFTALGVVSGVAMRIERLADTETLFLSGEGAEQLARSIQKYDRVLRIAGKVPGIVPLFLFYLRRR